jgi:transposase
LALDECSFRLNEVPRYGYSLKGSRAISQKPGKRGSTYTLILCIQNTDKQGVINYELIEGSAKSQSFHDFLTRINLSDEAKHYLIMDNARIHVAKKSCEDLGLPTVKEFLISRNIQLNYLPPYTPELNPVELCFNFLRQQIEKNKPRTYEELKLAIDKIIDILNQKDLTQYFRHCFDYNVG